MYGTTCSRKGFVNSRQQNSLKKEVSFSGIGLHTGKRVTLSFLPAAEDHGIVFRRVDLGGTPLIPALLDYVSTIQKRNTSIGYGDLWIHTVEHVLSALRAFCIDNVLVDIDASEPPAVDGSAQFFVQMIQQAGVQQQKKKCTIFSIRDPLYFCDGDVCLIALPALEYRISYLLDYHLNPAIGTQFHSFVLSKERFCQQIAPCRTFALYEELSYLMEQQLIRGGSLENAVVVKGDMVLSKEGLRFQDEMVRHKILDVIGDLALVGKSFMGHIIALRSGHASNVAFAKKILQHILPKA